MTDTVHWPEGTFNPDYGQTTSGDIPGFGGNYYTDYYVNKGGGGDGSHSTGGGGGTTGGNIPPPAGINNLVPPPSVPNVQGPMWYPGVNLPPWAKTILNTNPYYQAVKAGVLAPQMLWRLGGSIGNLMNKLFPGGPSRSGGGSTTGGGDGGGGGGLPEGWGLLGQPLGEKWGQTTPGQFGVGGPTMPAGGGSYFGGRANWGMNLPGSTYQLGASGGNLPPGMANLYLHSGRMQQMAQNAGFGSVGDWMRRSGFNLSSGWGSGAQGSGAGLSGAGRSMTLSR